eukprot:6820183-Prymnesium_polylepis.1
MRTSRHLHLCTPRASTGWSTPATATGRKNQAGRTWTWCPVPPGKLSRGRSIAARKLQRFLVWVLSGGVGSCNLVTSSNTD